MCLPKNLTLWSGCVLENFRTTVLLIFKTNLFLAHHQRMSSIVSSINVSRSFLFGAETTTDVSSAKIVTRPFLI
jgi:hypothetical protein